MRNSKLADALLDKAEALHRELGTLAPGNRGSLLDIIESLNDASGALIALDDAAVRARRRSRLRVVIGGRAS